MMKISGIFGHRVAKCSADDYFINKNGEYVFDRDKLHQAHIQCQDKARKAMRSGTDLVIIDNTNTTYKEIKPYLEMATNWDYRVVKRTIGGLDQVSQEQYAQRNVHGVPPDAIKRMAERFQK